ncbi:MAG TPA: flagellar motor protein MotB [Bryobacteraceae bacterium]|nr:flagellar motor protein MotB [Bryobacteraceae bacterium]
MPQSSSAQPIIIIKKKAAHHAGHHGGAWKVAYADFVTAMMALFIVLWLMASSEQVKQSIAAYFLDPQGKKHEVGSGGLTGSGKSMFLSIDDMRNLKAKLEQAFKSLPAIEKLKDQITMTITGEGLRIELVENSKGVFFESGSAKPTELGVEAVGVLGSQLGSLPNAVVIEGHTDAVPYAGAKGYSNWELSTDRANEARKLMQEHGIRADQIKQVRGYADQSLRNAQNPEDPSNRRISVIVLYGDPSTTPKVAVKGAEKGKGVATERAGIALGGPAPTR